MKELWKLEYARQAKSKGLPKAEIKKGLIWLMHNSYSKTAAYEILGKKYGVSMAAIKWILDKDYMAHRKRLNGWVRNVSSNNM